MMKRRHPIIGLNEATPSRPPVSRQLRIVTTTQGGQAVFIRDIQISHTPVLTPGGSGAHRSPVF